MNFELFNSMTPEEARDHLQGFLATERVAMDTLVRATKQAGVQMDYSIGSLSPVLKWILTGIQIIRVPVPATEPQWIRDFHRGGLIAFPDESKYLILRAAYYLGECFVRANSALIWTVGDPEGAEKNMPVVAGFRSSMEMAPMMVCENLFGRVVGDGVPETHIDAMVKTWVGFMP
jgi:hypothetical protein